MFRPLSQRSELCSSCIACAVYCFFVVVFFSPSQREYSYVVDFPGFSGKSADSPNPRNYAGIEKRSRETYNEKISLRGELVARIIYVDTLPKE